MAIPNDKSRIIITLPDRMKSDIEFLSITDKRTPSKEIEYMMEQYFERLEGRFPIEDYDNYYEETYKPKQLAERIITWLTSFSITQNHKTSSFIQIFKGENIDEKVIEMVMRNKKITDSKQQLFIECLRLSVNDINAQTLIYINQYYPIKKD